eukprot:463613-Rhodomonas_salina.1
MPRLTTDIPASSMPSVSSRETRACFQIREVRLGRLLLAHVGRGGRGGRDRREEREGRKGGWREGRTTGEETPKLKEGRSPTITPNPARLVPPHQTSALGSAGQDRARK